MWYRARYLRYLWRSGLHSPSLNACITLQIPQLARQPEFRFNSAQANCTAGRRVTSSLSLYTKLPNEHEYTQTPDDVAVTVMGQVPYDGATVVPYRHEQDVLVCC